MEYAIECIKLEKHYPDFTLGPIDLNVERGSVVGLVGSNGAGKTTLIKLLLGLTFPDEGTIKLNFEQLPHHSDSHKHSNEVIANPTIMPAYIKGRIGTVLDTCAFTQSMRVSDVNNLGRKAYANWDDTLFTKLTESFDLNPKKQVGKLSRGMGMKLSIAFALAHHPELLILDEATAGLDPIARDEILDILRNYMLNERHTILMSTHITSDLEKIADTITCIDNGKILFTKQKDELCDEAGIAHVRATQLEELEAEALNVGAPLHVIHREFSTDVLVENRFAFADTHPDIPVDRATIDEYMSIILKGDTRC